MSDVAYPRVQAHLARLKLPRMAECLDTVAQEAAKHDWTYVEFLDQLLDAEVSARYERDVAMKTKLAHFPFVKTLDQFDFAFQPAESLTDLPAAPEVETRPLSWYDLLAGVAR